MATVGDELLRKYQLTALLGEGGMGQVFEALHLQLKKKVAIKLLHAGSAEDEKKVLRFQREAQAAAAINHPGIIDIYDIGVDEREDIFLVMELLEGVSLAEALVAEGLLDEEKTAHIACQVLAALSAAHEMGVIHRDLKPENIFLVDSPLRDLEVKLLDFGISVVRTAADSVQTRLTKTGAVMGTPQYMSPEQATADKNLDHRADLFSLGVILYECVIGEPPFRGSNINEVVISIITKDHPPPKMKRPELSARFCRVIDRALSKSPSGRFESAREMLDEMLPLLDENHSGEIMLETLPSSPVPSFESLPTFENLAFSPTRDDSTVADSLAQTDVEPDNETWPEAAPTIVDTSPPIPQRRGLKLALIIVAILVVGSGALLLTPGLFSSNANAPPEMPPTSQPVEEAETTAPATQSKVQAGQPESTLVRIKATPAHASIFVDGALASSNPYEARFRRDAKEHRIEVSADGFETQQRLMSFARDVSLQIDLEQREQETEGAKSSGRTKVKTKRTKSNERREDPWRD